MPEKTRFAALAALFVLVLFVAACAPPAVPAAADSQSADVHAAGHLYGAELTLASETPLSDVLAGPEAFVGKVIQIKGTAVHVCKHSGKRLQLMDPDTEKAIMVDFSEVGLEFPAETVNHTVIAEGTLIRRDLAPAAVEDDHDHAEGEDHDHAEAAEGDDHAELAEAAEGEGENCAAEAAGADAARHVYVIAGTGARDLDL